MLRNFLNKSQFRTIIALMCATNLYAMIAHAQSQADSVAQSTDIFLNAKALLRAGYDDLYERKIHEVVDRLKARKLPAQKEPTVVAVEDKGSGRFKIIITDDRRGEMDWAMQDAESAVLLKVCVFERTSPSSRKQCVEDFYDKTVVMRALLGPSQ